MLSDAISNGYFERIRQMALVINQRLHQEGAALRKKILGEEHVRHALTNEDDLIEFHHLLGHECAYALVWPRTELEPKIRSLVTVAMLATLTPRGESFKAHMRGALINGASRAELRQVLAMISFYLGAGIGTEAIITAREVLSGDTVNGQKSQPAIAGDKVVPFEEIRDTGRKLMSSLFGNENSFTRAASDNEGNAVYENIKSDYYFGVLWSHPDLALRVRMLVVLGILCAGNRQAQLNSYLRAAQRLGCSHSEIKEVFLTACIYCGASACEDGFAAARRVFEP
jgi:4-carboxymuconolactone decarboxylase